MEEDENAVPFGPEPAPFHPSSCGKSGSNAPDHQKFVKTGEHPVIEECVFGILTAEDPIVVPQVRVFSQEGELFVGEQFEFRVEQIPNVPWKDYEPLLRVFHHTLHRDLHKDPSPGRFSFDSENPRMKRYFIVPLCL